MSDGEVIKAIIIIDKESHKYPTVKNPLHKLFECPFRLGSPFYYNWFLNIMNPVISHFKEIPFKMTLLQWMDDKSFVYFVDSTSPSNSCVFDSRVSRLSCVCDSASPSNLINTYKITFKKLFIMIMTIIENHKQKEYMKKRFIIELKKSVKLCFTERIKCMVSSLVGFVDDIYIGLSSREVIELKMDNFIKQLKDKIISRESVKEQMIEMFSHVGEKDNISDEYKKANLLALDDYENEFEGFDRL